MFDKIKKSNNVKNKFFKNLRLKEMDMSEIVVVEDCGAWKAYFKDNPEIWSRGQTRDMAIFNFGADSVRSKIKKISVDGASHRCQTTDQSKPFCSVCGKLLGGF